MAQALGTVTKGDNGDFEGVLAMGVNSRIKIVANETKVNDAQPDYRIYSDELGEIGGAWNRTGKASGKPYL